MSISPLRKYTRNLLITGAVLAVISQLTQIFMSENIFPAWIVLLLFMVAIQWLLFAFVSKFAQHKQNTLLKQYQIAKYAKLFTYMIAIAIYAFVIQWHAMPFLITFIVYYLIFTFLETWFVHRWMNTLPRTPDGRNKVAEQKPTAEQTTEVEETTTDKQ